MKKILYFLESIEDFTALNIIQGELESKIFSFNIYVHKLLEVNGIDHFIAEDYLSEDDKIKIFDRSVACWNWYKADPISKNFEFDGINILGISDTTEFHSFIMNEIFNFLIIKRIIEKEKPDKIVASDYFALMIRSIVQNKNIELETIRKISHKYIVPWDKILFRFNITKIPISISISRTTYTKMKNFIELLMLPLLNLHFNLKDKNKSLLFLEFNPILYSELFYHLSKTKKNLIFFNMRRSAIWSFSSIKILKKFKCKIITQKILNSKEKNVIQTLTTIYLKKLDAIWTQEEDYFLKFFSIENNSYWNSIKNPLLEIYKKRISDYIELIALTKKIVKNCNISCIISLNSMGETEKVLHEITKNRISSIMLQHAFTTYIPELKRFDLLDTSIFYDKIALWGEIQKKYLMENHNVSENKIFVVGSPRHDQFFKNKISANGENQKIIVITTQSMELTLGQVDTNTYVRLEKLFKEIFAIIKKLPGIKVVIKLHPAQDVGNEYLKKIILQLEPNITIYQETPILQIIRDSHAIININSELFPSTTVLEGMMLSKPILNIVMSSRFYEFDFIKYDTVLSVSDKEHLEKHMLDIIFNEKLRNKLANNGRNYAIKYLANPGSASKYLATILESF